MEWTLFHAGEKLLLGLLSLLAYLFESFGCPLLDERPQVVLRALVPGVRAASFSFSLRQVEVVLLSLGRLFVDVPLAALVGVLPGTDLDVDSLLAGALIARFDLLDPQTDSFVAFTAKVGSILRGSPSLLALQRGGFVGGGALGDLTLASLAELALDLVGLGTANFTSRAEFKGVLLPKAALRVVIIRLWASMNFTLRLIGRLLAW